MCRTTSVSKYNNVHRFLRIALPKYEVAVVLIVLLDSVSTFQIFNRVCVLSKNSNNINNTSLAVAVLVGRRNANVGTQANCSNTLNVIVFIILNYVVNVR